MQVIFCLRTSLISDVNSQNESLPYEQGCSQIPNAQTANKEAHKLQPIYFDIRNLKFSSTVWNLILSTIYNKYKETSKNYT